LAEEKLRLYIGDPAPMRLARLIALADARLAQRRRKERDTRTFWFDGAGPGSFPLRFRGRGHLALLTALARYGGACCSLPSVVQLDELT
jgi:hypothetical protein